jgi:hypothetical protein
MVIEASVLVGSISLRSWEKLTRGAGKDGGLKPLGFPDPWMSDHLTLHQAISFR